MSICPRAFLCASLTDTLATRPKTRLSHRVDHPEPGCALYNKTSEHMKDTSKIDDKPILSLNFSLTHFKISALSTPIVTMEPSCNEVYQNQH